MRDRKTARPGGIFDKKLCAAIVAHAQLRLSAGERVAGIAESLSIKGDTLHYWLDRAGIKQRRKQTRFRRVRVVEAVVNEKAGVTVFGPGGTRIDGLSLGQAAELLRRMS